MGAISRWAGMLAGWCIVVVIAAATAIGAINRWVDADGEYFLLTRAVAERPILSALIGVVSLAGYALGFRLLCRAVAGWRHGATSAPPRRRVAVALAGATGWVFARWWRISLVLAVAWLPWYATSFPGQPNPDFARTIGEFLLQRSDFGEEPAPIAPFEAYPTSQYLMTDSERIWSNHHNFYLMLYYGAGSKLSLVLFDSLMPAIFVFAALSGLFTLVAFGRSFGILGEFVTAWKVRLAAFVVVAASPLIALWSISHTKNHLFAAAFVWWLALLARFVHRDHVTKRWYVETAFVSIVIAVSVLFGWMLLLVQAVAMLWMRRRRFAGLIALGIPALVLHFSVSGLVSAGVIIPSDPIETKGLQLQQLALILKEHPDTLSADDEEALSRLFDIEAMRAAFDPDISDPVKSTGPWHLKTDSYRYQSVEEGDWDAFNGIYLRAAVAHPDTFLDGLVLKTYRYVDPLDEGTNFYPPWLADYARSVGEHPIAPVAFNDGPREEVRSEFLDCFGTFGCRPLLSHSVRTVAVLLLLAAAMVVGRRDRWFWALPFGLQIGVVALSPLSAGGRYGLGFTYALAAMILILAIDDRRSDRSDPEESEESEESEASATPAPADRPAPRAARSSSGSPGS